MDDSRSNPIETIVDTYASDKIDKGSINIKELKDGGVGSTIPCVYEERVLNLKQFNVNTTENTW